MRDEYDFSQSIPNPYWNKLRHPVTISVDDEIISYFQAQENETGIPWRHIISLYLLDCANNQKFNRIMKTGLNQAKAGLSRDADTVFNELERGL